MYLRQTAQLEELERQKIELRRKEHQERLQRIMDERNREIGMDYDFLAKQVAERKAREAAEKAEEDEYQRRFLEEQRLLGRLAKQEQRIRAQIAKEDNEFRENYQKPEMTREYDITRPDYKAVAEPVRATDNDPWLSVSGGQKFDGEDLASDDRKKRQREQLLQWQKEQMAEMEHRRALELKEQREWEQRYIEQNRMMVEIGQQEKEARREVQHQINKENDRLSKFKKQLESEMRNDDLESNFDEMNKTNTSPFMSESRQQAVGVNGKMVTQDWKGMTDEEKLRIIEERRQIMLENQRLRQEEAEREQREEMERQRSAREALRRERAEMRARKQKEKELAEQYLRDAEEQKQREYERNTEIYGTNQPNEDFWNYFGKSHR